VALWRRRPITLASSTSAVALPRAHLRDACGGRRRNRPPRQRRGREPRPALADRFGATDRRGPAVAVRLIVFQPRAPAGAESASSSTLSHRDCSANAGREPRPHGTPARWCRRAPRCRTHPHRTGVDTTYVEADRNEGAPQSTPFTHTHQCCRKERTCLRFQDSFWGVMGRIATILSQPGPRGQRVRRALGPIAKSRASRRRNRLPRRRRGRPSRFRSGVYRPRPDIPEAFCLARCHLPISRFHGQ